MIKAADKIPIPAISEKLNSTMKMKIADIQDIDYLITELPPDNIALQPYRTKEVELL